MALFTEEMRRDPYPVYAQLRGRSVMHMPLMDLWMVMHHGDVKRVLHDAAVFSSNPATSSRGASFEWLLFLDPPRHTQLRAIISKAFTPRSVAALEPRITELAHGLVDAMLAKSGQGEVDLVAELAQPLPMLVIAELLGLPHADAPRLARWSDAIVGLGNTISGDGAEAAERAYVAAETEMIGYVDAALADRRGAPRDDLLSRLVTAEIDGAQLSERELFDFFLLLLAAGTETTTNLIGNAMICFAQYPDQLARVLAEPALLPRAIEEVLRFRSPVQAMFRTTTRTVELGGQTIPAQQFVVAMIGAANRDPQAFADADRFDVTRDANPHLAFGHGIHFCLGAALSRLEGRVALGYLLERAPRFQLATDTWPPRAAFHVHGPSALPIRFESTRAC